MSNKSGTSEQVISLPTGGGALSGIGEKFSPDLHTGTGNFTTPIAIPPGRNGFQPELSLVYSTGNGNGPFGLGWSLSIPGVIRKTSQGIPRYRDGAAKIEERDTFILSGAEDLVPVPGRTATTSRYRPRTEGLFARIIHHRDAANDYWEVRSKDGLVSLYGTPESAGNDPAVVAEPADRTKVFAWKLSRTEDPFGNRIEYEYERDMGEDGPHHWDQLYLKRIRYVDYGDDRDQEQFLVSVTFDYGDPAVERLDTFSDYRAGFEIRTRRRCQRIMVQTHAGEDRLVRTYELVYLDQRSDLADLDQRLPLNGVSLLSQVKVVGYDGDRTEKLPPLEFDYSQFEPKKRAFFSLKGRDLPAQSLGNPDTELVDLFGNGLPDIIQMNGSIRYWRNLGDGQFDLPRQMHQAPAGLQLADPGVQLIDANGDGRTDLLTTTNGLAGYFPLRFGGLWDRRSFQKYELAPSFNLQDPEVKLVDLDGDGVTDAIRSGSRLELFFNDPQEGWNDTRWIERRSLDAFPNINFSDPRVKWGDMSGDSLQDILLVYDGNVEYWPNLGYGNWGRRISMRHCPRFPYGYDPRRILVGDVDGDGLADIVYVDHGRVMLWINQSGNRWRDPIEINGTPDVSDLDAVRLVDLNGSGVSGVLWSADASVSSRDHLFFLDFTGGTKPYLLNEMNNHLGAVTRVAYTASTRFYLADQKKPETRWQTPLPFPVQVVARVEVIDELSKGKLTTEYRYHHGYWDGAEREFRGFGMVEQLDTESFEIYNRAGLHGRQADFVKVDDRQHFSPPTLTKTWFHQGPIGDEFGEWEEPDYSHEYWPGDPQVLERPPAMRQFLKGLPRRVKRDALRTLRGQTLRTELYALDGSEGEKRPYSVTESLPGLREEAGAGQDKFRVFFPHALTQRTTQWERGDEPMTTFTFSDDYDEYGRPRTQISIAVPRQRDIGVQDDSAAKPYLATLAETTYAQRDDNDRYIVDRVARTTSYEVVNDGTPTLFDLVATIKNGSAERNIIGQALNFYDGDAFAGLPLGQIGDFGALVRTETLVLTDDILNEAYKRGESVLDPPEKPPYLVPGDAPAWTDEYPQAFRDQLPALAGYTYQPGGTASAYAAGYFATTAQSRYDFHDDANGQGRGLSRASRDPLGHETTIAYDDYDLLPVQVTDAAGLVTQARYDYRTLQPRLVTDRNGNRTAFAFTPLGLLEKTAVMGKEGEEAGDSLDAPGTRLEYDFLAFSQRRQPVSVRTIQRVHHVHDTDIPLPKRDETIAKTEYSDGFGRLLQTRSQAEDVNFGDTVFGNDVLPADQSATPGDAVGRVRAADDPPNVVVSGWQIYNNKGWVVEKYEPFFSAGWEYARPIDAERGQKATLFYDPRGQVIRTVNPDGSEQRVIYGVPADLADPDTFTPTPWETTTYEANDNAGRTHPGTTQTYRHHWDTPTSAEVDALGRTVRTVERNRRHLGDGTWTEIEAYHTHSTFDIRGNLLSVTDALGRLNFRHVYDLANNPLRIENIDAGVQRTVLDAAGNEIEGRDSKGALILQGYDGLNRPIRLWARDQAEESITLRQQLVYGDSADAGLTETEAKAANLSGRLYHHYDEAGLLALEKYDFKGNLLEKTRQVIGDTEMLRVIASRPEDGQITAYRVDWQPPAGTSLSDYAGSLLEVTEYRTATAYDGLNRIKTVRYPQDEDGERKRLTPRYNRAGALEQVELEGTTYVEHIAYNARGQRVLITYGNGIMTRYAYDRQTFRLARLRSERYERPAGTTYTYRPVARNQPLQEFGYTYDLAGNILSMVDRTPGSGVQDNPEAALVTDAQLRALVAAGNALVRRFTYDPLNRLVSASGRECKNIPRPRPWTDDRRCGFNSGKQGTPSQDNAPHLTAPYRETYSYDPVGNMLALRHDNNGQSWTRHFGMGGLTPAEWQSAWQEHLGGEGWPNAPGNRLTHVGDDSPTAPQTHHFDANGNLIRENGTRHFEWEHGDRLRVFRNQVANGEPSLHAHYLYDAAGQRVKKLVRKQSGDYDLTVYVDGLFEHHRWQRGTANGQNNHLHVMDDQQRIALIRVGDPHPDDRGPAVQFHLGDHLGSSSLVIDENGAWVNREEYTPYGETSFGSFARKRYRYTGKERDEESGLYYHGARYYAPWLGRWVSCDPAGMVDGVNLYLSFLGNPIAFIDSNGMQTEPPVSHTNSEQDLSTYIRNEAGFAQGKETPPNLDPKSAAKFGTDAHNKQIGRTISDMKEVGFKGAEKIHEGVRVDKRTGKVEGVGLNPGGKGKWNFDWIFGKSKDRPQTLDDIETTVDAKYGASKVNKGQAMAGPKHMTVGDKIRMFPSQTSRAGVRAVGGAAGQTVKSFIPGAEVYDYVKAVGEASGGGFLQGARVMSAYAADKISTTATTVGAYARQARNAAGPIMASAGATYAAAKASISSSSAAIAAKLSAGAAGTAAVTVGAGIAAAGSMAILAETVRAASKGEETPYEVAVDFWSAKFESWFFR